MEDKADGSNLLTEDREFRRNRAWHSSVVFPSRDPDVERSETGRKTRPDRMEQRQFTFIHHTDRHLNSAPVGARCPGRPPALPPPPPRSTGSEAILSRSAEVGGQTESRQYRPPIFFDLPGLMSQSGPSDLWTSVRSFEVGAVSLVSRVFQLQVIRVVRQPPWPIE